MLFAWLMILTPGFIINFIIHKWSLKKQATKSSEIWLLIINGIILSPLMGLTIFSNSNGGYGSGLAALMIPVANTGLSVLFIIYVALSDREPEVALSSTANSESGQ